MASNAEECSLWSEGHLEQNLPQVPACAIKVMSKAVDMHAPTPVIQTPEIYIKKEPEDENEDVTVKEEPFLYDNQCGSSQHLSSAPVDLLSPVPLFCCPVKMEVKAERDAGVPAPASGNTDGVAGSKQEVSKGSIPKQPEPNESRVFRARKYVSWEKPENIHVWLKKHKLHRKKTVHLRKTDYDNYDKVLRYLIRFQDVIKSHQKTPLKEAIEFGYFLQLLFKNRFQKDQSEIRTFSFETIVSEHIGINKTFATNLRWLGKLGYQYPILGNVSLYLYQVFRRKAAISHLFKKYPHLANKWKRRMHSVERNELSANKASQHHSKL
ncbi:uncharacterized protein LOC108675776 [Hyalella azteca]|uniref:Uncharacterized protein LOC108675776 n=1 Tax=Hyalella azteca TaxID=294128 RepID=A0A8B7NZW3_HYAAZ|nr:uncharacterized protein LOC108675776 [Hyalella azteca]